MSLHRLHRCRLTLEDARDALRGGEAHSACRTCEAALRERPDHVGLRRVHARALLALGRADEALRTLQAAEMYRRIDGRPFSRQAHLSLHLLHARALAALHRAPEAQRHLAAALEIEPMHRVAALRLASLIIASDPQGTAKLLEPFHAAHPHDRAVLRLLARAYEATGLHPRALELWTALGGSGLRIARLCRAAGRLADATDGYARLLAAHPHDADLHVEAAEVAVERGDDRAASALLQRALHVSPHHAAAGAALAREHLRTGRFEDAAIGFARLARLVSAPDTRPAALAGLAVAAAALSRHRLADAARRRLATLTDTDTRRTLLAALHRLALVGSVARSLVRGRRDPAPASPLEVMLTEAAGILDQHRAARPTHADLHYHHAVCAEALGDVDAAGASLDAALAVNPNYKAAIAQRQRLAA